MTETRPHVHSYKVPADEQISVRTGDIIAVWYSQNRFGVPNALANGNAFPETTVSKIILDNYCLGFYSFTCLLNYSISIFDLSCRLVKTCALVVPI